VLTVRRYQATLRRGNRESLEKLRDAAVADEADAFARAVAHVLCAFDSRADPIDPPPLSEIAAQPEATKQLLMSWLDGTVNEALAIVCDCGMIRRELSDYDLSGADRVAPVATTAVGRVYGALTRLLDLGARLFHRARSEGHLVTEVALVSPLAAVLSGSAQEDDAELIYEIGSALTAATPPLALVEALGEDEVANLVGALLAGFGPVEQGSVSESSPEQMRIAEDLWHMVPAAGDRRLRSICKNTREISIEVAVANAKATRRRAGLFACGDVLTAMMQTVRELDLPIPRVGPGGDALRELCVHPAIADIYDLSILPEYAEARWRS